MPSTISPILFESVSQTTATPSVQLGTRVVDDNGYEYIYVYNHGQETFPGRCVYLKTLSSGYTVSDTNTAAQIGQFAGAVHHATLPTEEYGWIMIKGKAKVAPDTNAVSFNAGDYLAVGVDAGYILRAMTVTSGAVNGHLFSQMGPPIGVALSSGLTNAGTSTGTMADAWIRSHVW